MRFNGDSAFGGIPCASGGVLTREMEFSCGPQGAYGCFRLMALPERARSPPSNENSRSLRDQLNSFPSWSIGDSNP